MRIIIDFSEKDQDDKCHMASIMNRLVFIKAKFSCHSFGKRYFEFDPETKGLTGVDGLQDGDEVIDKMTPWKENGWKYIENLIK